MNLLSHIDIRNKFFDFFEKEDHRKFAPAPLMQDDQSVLFTTAGMQQFKDYYTDPKIAPYKNLVTIQPCLRTSDIEEVGDESHNTFFEMLGNFSFNGYFKEKAIKLAYEFLVKELKIDKENLYVSVFPGDKEIPLDQESIKIARKIGIPDSSIKMGDRSDNFWGPVGDTGVCGPTLEFYYKNKDIDLEIWNIVFNEYYLEENGNYKSLKYKGIDTGIGFERLAQILQSKKNIYETDLLDPVYANFENQPLTLEEKRIMTDHVRACVFLVASGVEPSNKLQGYILRRLIRRIYTYIYINKIDEKIISDAIFSVKNIYKEVYPSLIDSKHIEAIIYNEFKKFSATLNSGLKVFEKMAVSKAISSQNIFKLYESYGFPVELTKELAKKRKIKVNDRDVAKLFKKHQKISRADLTMQFKGGLASHGEMETKYHTATHLLLAALKELLDSNIIQRGSNITSERLRFDFNYPRKLTDKEIDKIEDLVNSKIKQAIPVGMEEMPRDKALLQVKVSFDPEKYSEMVKVYKIGDFSVELCGGPHVKNTAVLGNFKILKEEASSSGVRRIKAVLK